MSKTFTLREVAEALINDPTPKAKGTFFRKPGRRKNDDNLFISEMEVEQGKKEVFDYQKGDYIVVDVEDVRVGATCALGGAAVGLGVDAASLLDALNEIRCDMGVSRRAKAYRDSAPFAKGTLSERETPYLGTLIYSLNDGTQMSKRALGERILEQCKDFLDVQMTAREVEYHAKFAGRDI